MGDVKLAGMLGLYLGRAVAPAIFLALILGVVVGAVVIARLGAKAGRKTAVPFGPFLAVGGIVGFFVGDDVMDEYLDRFWRVALAAHPPRAGLSAITARSHFSRHVQRIAHYAFGAAPWSRPAHAAADAPTAPRGSWTKSGAEVSGVQAAWSPAPMWGRGGSPSRYPEHSPSPPSHGKATRSRSSASTSIPLASTPPR